MKLLVLFLLAVSAVATIVPGVPDRAGWVEPEYVNEQGYKLDSTMIQVAESPRKMRFAEPAAAAAAPAAAGAAPTTAAAAVTPIPPGPYLSSYATRMDGFGNMVPPYAFDPKYAVLGPYRALTNRYSDGTSYPLNMNKYDAWGGAAGAAGAGVGAVAAAAAPAA